MYPRQVSISGADLIFRRGGGGSGPEFFKGGRVQVCRTWELLRGGNPPLKEHIGENSRSCRGQSLAMDWDDTTITLKGFAVHAVAYRGPTACVCVCLNPEGAVLGGGAVGIFYNSNLKSLLTLSQPLVVGGYMTHF